MSTPSHLKPLLFFFLIHYTLQSPTNDQSNDPSVGAGTLALPLALHAKRIHEQRSYPTEPSTHSSTLVDQMPATPAANNRVETLFPSTTEVNEPTTQSPMMVWSRKIKNLKLSSQSPSTTPLNDLPLLLSPSQLTTPTIPPSTLNDPLTRVTPSSSSLTSISTTTQSQQLTTKFALRSAKHHRHGKGKPTEETVQVSRTEPSPTDDLDSLSTVSSTPQTTVAYEHRQRCVLRNSKEFINSATTCKNDRTDRICSLLFDEPDPQTGRRDPKCNVAGMEDIANSCRRQCGICCEHIDYACEDDANHIIDCNKQLDKCQMTKWFDVLARFCAGSCGLCTRTACRDFSEKCREMKHLCLEPSNIDFMRANCSRTCGFCVVGPGGISENPLKRLPVPQCIDHASNCTENEALCSSPMHAEFMIKYCAKTCFKCTGDASQVIVPVIGTSPELNGTAAVLVPASVIMGAARPDNSECVDHHPKCAIWVAKGFCTHSKYTNEQRLALCPKSCKLC